MESPIVTIIVSLLAACGGAWGIVEAVLKRKWQKEDRTNEVLDKLNAIQEETNNSIKSLKESTDKSVENVYNTLMAHIDEQEKQSALTSRTRIVRVADDIRHGNKVGEEVLKSTLEEITLYNDYCEKHKNFKNSIAEISIELIKDEYTKTGSKK